MKTMRGVLLVPAGALLGVLVACGGGGGSGPGGFQNPSGSSSGGSSGSGSGGSSSGPAPQSDGGSADKGAPDTGTPDTGTCIPTSSQASCASNADCCQSGSDQPLGALCASQTGSSVYTCHAKCNTNSECVSGCCAAVNGGGSVCAPASDCAPSTCTQNIGQSCTTQTDCCQSDPSVPYGETCLNLGSGSGAECGANCYHNSECASGGCCAQLQGQNYGVCVSNASSSTVCMP